MRYVAAYALAVLGGKTDPSKKDLETIIGSVGIDADAERTNAVLAALKGKNLEEIIKSGLEKLATVPSGGGGAAPAAAAGPAAAAAPAAAKKEEKKKEESEEEDDDMGFGLFD